MRWTNALTNLLYPPACLLCHARLSETNGPAVICTGCAQRLEPPGPPVCARCGVGVRGAFDAAALCASCRSQPPTFEQARAAWRYAGPAEDAVRQFKYHRRWRLGEWLADEMAVTARASLPLHEIDAVVPVPAHWLKARVRGFAPTRRLAARVAGALALPHRPEALRCVRWTSTQTKLSWGERRRNVASAFRADPTLVAGRTLLLVDDVVTSGATAEACARALTGAGALRVFVLSAARTPLEH